MNRGRGVGGGRNSKWQMSRWQIRNGGRTSPWLTLRVSLSPSAGRSGTGSGSLAGASGSVLGWGGGGTVGAAYGSEDGVGAAAAFDGVFGGLHGLAEDFEGFVGELVVVGAAVESAEVEEGGVGRGDLGLLEPEGEGGEGEGVGRGVGGDGGGAYESFEQLGVGGGKGQIAKGPKGQIRRGGGRRRRQSSKWQSCKAANGGRGVGGRREEGALSPTLSRGARERGPDGDPR